MSLKHHNQCNTSRLGRISRRDFMKTVAITAVGASFHWSRGASAFRSGNVLPGRIAIIEKLDASSGSTVNLAVIQQMVDDGLMWLTGQPNPVAALESLFPGLDTSKRIAIKVNILESLVPTRWEMIKALTDRLVQMLGGTFPAGNITVFDNVPGWCTSTMAGCGFTAESFPDIVISDESNPDPGTQIWVGDTNLLLSSHIVNCDYLINCPVLKEHRQTGKYWTLGFKNHIGSVSPMTCHSYEPRLLTLSASPHLKDKTKLVMLSGIHGIYVNGPEGPAQGWDLFPEEATPNLIMLSTDPVSLEHWGIHLINEERSRHGIDVFQDTYCQNAANPPYDLGIYDFAAHDVFTALPAPEGVTASKTEGGILLSWNPVSGASKYVVFGSADPMFRPDPWGGSNILGETTEASFLDPGEPGPYPKYYVVQAFRACWYSPDSNRVGVFPYTL